MRASRRKRPIILGMAGRICKILPVFFVWSPLDGWPAALPRPPPADPVHWTADGPNSQAADKSYAEEDFLIGASGKFMRGAGPGRSRVDGGGNGGAAASNDTDGDARSIPAARSMPQHEELTSESPTCVAKILTDFLSG